MSTPPSRTERLAAVEVEEVAEPEAHHEDRVHDRVHVVGADVGQPHREDVGLALDRHEVLLVARCSVVTSCTASTSPACTDVSRVGRLPRLEDLTGGRLAGRRSRPAFMPRNVSRSLRVPLPLALLQHAHRARPSPKMLLLMVVSIWKTLMPVFLQHLAHAPVRRVQLALVAVHERRRVLHGLDVVVVAERCGSCARPVAVRLPAAVHRHEVDVDVDDQVALGGPLVDLDLLALGRSCR